MVLEFISNNLFKHREGWWVNDRLVDPLDYYPIVIEPSEKIEYISIAQQTVFFKLIEETTRVCSVEEFIREEIWLG